jgi:hypothetical protein
MEALRTTFQGQTVEITDVPSGRLVSLGGAPSQRLTVAPPPRRPTGSTEDIQGILAAAGGMEVVPASSVMIARPQPKGTSSQHGAITDARGLRPVTQSGQQHPVDGRPGTRSGRLAPHPAGRRGATSMSAGRIPAHQQRAPTSALPVVIGVIGLLAVGAFVALASGHQAKPAVRTSHELQDPPPPPVASATPVATAPPTPPNAGLSQPDVRPLVAAPTAPVSPQTIDPVLGEGLVAWYRFADQLHPGRDDSGNGHHSEVVNSGLTVVADDQTGTALQLDGTGRMIIPSPVSTDFTILVWLRTNQDGHDNTPFEVDLAQWYWGLGIADGDIPGMVDDFGMAILGGKLTFGLGARTEKTVFGSQRIDTGTWHHLAVSRSNHGEIHLYVDGQNDGIFDGPAGARSATRVLTIGGISTNPSHFLIGRMADLRFYDRVLSQVEVRTVLHAPHGK